MAPVNSSTHWCVQELQNNPPETFLDASEVLVKVATNILDNFENPKYRNLRLGNKMVQNRLLPVTGAMETLFAMGFQEDGENLTFPLGSNVDEMTQIRNDLVKERLVAMKQHEATQPAQPIVPAQSPSVAPSAQSPNIQASEMKFYAKLQNSSEHVMIYEDPVLQQKARDTMPLDDLTAQAKKTLEYAKKNCTDPKDLPGLPDCLLLELMNWFKTSFFKWVDQEPCDLCKGKTVSIGMLEPSVEDLKWGASRVEGYKCNSCNRIVKFPRYNHPGKLLESRKGRCGEWANCFTLCCRAVGLEARYVLDWTDHVWTEYYSESAKRWLHCDPCENQCDKPLTYEHGWGKKLSYIIAFAHDDIQDVTWRYSAKHTEVRSRRIECREDWLVKTIFKMRTEKQKNMSEAKKKIMQDRLVVEMVEFLTPKIASASEGQGRQSGSVAWRLSRGETKTDAQPYVFKLTESEKHDKEFYITYSAALDKYCRPSERNEVTNSWSSMLSECKNIFRKEERDWNMVYLARTEGTPSASISWTLDCSDSGLAVDSIEILVCSKTYENGKVTWILCADDQCIPVAANNRKTITEMEGKKRVTLTAKLSGGNGDCAWQHTQLFRQPIDATETPFELKVTLI
ncbi:unnamed protein product [Owenia fusiformis]|uniref:Peptide-N(4)-(N-acetyl-beta-glucosaminyl)asparagine amidase n=1 Tax=Owenia fusiformis TaxID=6347 RepID=A0A8J1XSW1_OWEFU|nr:unnamed protein product [Owenia fusiformis]